jgi:class 3 adenylate cyclase
MLAAEVAGYSSLLRADDKGTREQLEAHRDQFVYPKIAEHSGRIVRATDGSLLVEFESPTEAVRCAVELQRGMIDRNIRTLPERRITFRVGVTNGHVTGNGDDLVIRAVAALPRDTLSTLIKPGAEIYGECGNIAMRLAALAEPAGVCICGAVRDAIRDQLPYTFEDIGKQNLELHAAPVHCYAMNAASAASGPRLAAQSPQRRPTRLRSAAVAGGVFATVGVWGVALLVWLGTNSPTPTPAPTTAGSRAPAVGAPSDGAALAEPASQAPPAGGAMAERDAQEASASQPSLASNSAAVNGGIQALPSRPAPSEISAVVVKGKQPPSVPDEDGTVLQATANSVVVRGKPQASALQATSDGGAAVVRGNQEPPPLQIAPDGATDVVRGTRK